LVLSVSPLLGRTTRGVTLHDVQFAESWILFLAVGQLSWQIATVQHALASGQVTGLAGSFPGTTGLERLSDDFLGDPWILGEELAKLFVDHALDKALDLGVSQLALGLSLELWIRMLDREHHNDSFSGVIAGDVRVLGLEQVLRLSVHIDGPSQRSLEPGDVGTPLDGVDVVGKTQQLLLVGSGPLQSQVHLDSVLFASDSDGLLVDHSLVGCQVLHKSTQAALVVKLLGLVVALIHQGDAHAGVQKCHLPHTLGENLHLEGVNLKDGAVGMEADAGSPFIGVPHALEIHLGNTAGV